MIIVFIIRKSWKPSANNQSSLSRFMFYLFERMKDREGKTERKILPLRVHFPSGYSDCGWARPNPGAWNCIQISYAGGSVRAIGASSTALEGSWIRDRAARMLMSTPLWDACLETWLLHLSTSCPIIYFEGMFCTHCLNIMMTCRLYHICSQIGYLWSETSCELSKMILQDIASMLFILLNWSVV